MKTIRISRDVTAIRFAGRDYEIAPVTVNRSQVLTAARRGILDHVGSTHEQLAPQCQGFQIYRIDGRTLLAAAVSCQSQHIDTVFYLHPIDQ